MGELQQLRAAIFDLTEQVRRLNENLERPTHGLARQTERLADLLHVMEEIPEKITMTMDDATMSCLEDHRASIDALMLDR